jgi:uncharacterized protein (DUF362 family)
MMSSRLTRITGITAGTLISGGLLLGGAAPAFADTNNTVNANTNNTATVTQSATANGNSQDVSGSPYSTNVNGVAANVSVIKQQGANRFSIRQRGNSGPAVADTNNTVNANTTNEATVDQSATANNNSQTVSESPFSTNVNGVAANVSVIKQQGANRFSIRQRGNRN